MDMDIIPEFESLVPGISKAADLFENHPIKEALNHQNKFKRDTSHKEWNFQNLIRFTIKSELVDRVYHLGYSDHIFKAFHLVVRIVQDDDDGTTSLFVNLRAICDNGGFDIRGTGEIFFTSDPSIFFLNINSPDYNGASPCYHIDFDAVRKSLERDGYRISDIFSDAPTPLPPPPNAVEEFVSFVPEISTATDLENLLETSTFSLDKNEFERSTSPREWNSQFLKRFTIRTELVDRVYYFDRWGRKFHLIVRMVDETDPKRRRRIFVSAWEGWYRGHIFITSYPNLFFQVNFIHNYNRDATYKSMLDDGYHIQSPNFVVQTLRSICNETVVGNNIEKLGEHSKEITILLKKSIDEFVNIKDTFDAFKKCVPVRMVSAAAYSEIAPSVYDLFIKETRPCIYRDVIIPCPWDLSSHLGPATTSRVLEEKYGSALAKKMIWTSPPYTWDEYLTGLFQFDGA